MRKGVPVSPGVVVARAYCLDAVGLPRSASDTLPEAARSAEIDRLDRACAEAARDLEAVAARVAHQVGERQAAIFLAHRDLLRDPLLLDKVQALIRERGQTAPAALQATLQETIDLFSRLPDARLRDRLSDMRDVIGRLQAHLGPGGAAAPAPGLCEPVILVAAEIFPSQALGFDRGLIAGIATEHGSTTGHAAILARSLGIPAVAGVPELTRDVRTNDLLALDGREGHIYLNPGPEVESAYRKLQREFVDLRGKLAANRGQEAVTPDGCRVELLANVNGVSDAVAADAVGAEGVGLYRTEYLFLTHPSVPDEEEQYAKYRGVVEAAPGRKVTIRTLDLGGDKQVPYLGHQHEANPFLGWRSIRLASAFPEFFGTQLRAILRAAAHGHVSLLFPMISTLDEVWALKETVDRVRTGLLRDGVAIGKEIPIGVMIEVPAAALCIDEILNVVDYVSIGSNDLVQYLMAADRDNPKVAHLCEPFHPALLRLIDFVVSACDRKGKPVTLCGEMAGMPRCFLMLLGLGLRRLSMSPAVLPSIKQVLRHTPLPAAREAARRVLAMHTASEVRDYLTDKVRELWPDVNLLDMRK